MLFNPLYPPILGDFLNLGDTPKPLAKGLCPPALPRLLNSPYLYLRTWKR